MRVLLYPCNENRRPAWRTTNVAYFLRSRTDSKRRRKKIYLKKSIKKKKSHDRLEIHNEIITVYTDTFLMLFRFNEYFFSSAFSAVYLPTLR